MCTWTIAEEVTVRMVYSPQVSGPAVFAALTLTARPDLSTRHATIEPGADVDLHWLPDIKAGFEEFLAELACEGRAFGFIRLEVSQVRWHESDTDGPTMRRATKMALRELFASARLLELG